MAKKIFKNLLIKSSKNLKAINCPAELNSSAIDEFLVIFLIAAKAKGISYFKDLSELNQKESPRLIWGSKILNMMGIKTDLTKDSIKIYGQPNLEIKKPITIKNYLKDHRVFMMSTIAALTFGGKWKIYNKDSMPIPDLCLSDYVEEKMLEYIRDFHEKKEVKDKYNQKIEKDKLEEDLKINREKFYKKYLQLKSQKEILTNRS